MTHARSAPLPSDLPSSLRPAAPASGEPRPAPGVVHEADDGTFDALVAAAPGAVLVELGATWCGPCRALEPVVASFAAARAGDVTVLAVDLDDAPGVATRYGVRGAPTLLVLRDGELRARHVGVTDRAGLEALMARA